MRSTLEASAEKPGPFGEQARAKLDGPEAPEELGYLLDWFMELRAAQGFVLLGDRVTTQPIGWRDLRAWSEMTGSAPTPQEARALISLDGVARNAGHEGD